VFVVFSHYVTCAYIYVLNCTVILSDADDVWVTGNLAQSSDQPAIPQQIVYFTVFQAQILHHILHHVHNKYVTVLNVSHLHVCYFVIFLQIRDRLCGTIPDSELFIHWTSHVKAVIQHL
jgi:hypothetical protein